MEQKQSKYKELFNNTVIFAIGNFSVKLVQFFIMPLVTIALLPEEYNTAELLNSSIEIIFPIVSLGISDAIFRFAINKDIKKESVLTNSMFLFAIGTIIVSIATVIIALTTKQSYWYTFIALYFTVALSTVMSQFVRGIEKVVVFSVSGIIQALVLAGAMYLFTFVKKMGINGYLLAMVCSNIARILYIMLSVNIKKYISIKAFDKEVFKKMLIYALPLVPNMISWWLTQTSSRYIATAMLGSEITGLFTAASRLPAVVNIFSTIFLQAWLISTAKSFDDKDKGVFNTNIYNIYASFIALVTSVVMIATPLLSKFLLQGQFYQGWVYTEVLLFAAYLGCLSSYFGAFYGAAMKTTMSMVSTVVGAVLNILICIILIPIIGIYALLVASAVAYLSIVVIRVITTKEYSLIKLSYIKEILTIVVLAVQGFVVSFIKEPLYLFQAGCLVLVVLIRIKDIIKIIKDFVKIVQGFKNKKNEGKENEKRVISE